MTSNSPSWAILNRSPETTFMEMTITQFRHTIFETAYGSDAAIVHECLWYGNVWMDEAAVGLMCFERGVERHNGGGSGLCFSWRGSISGVETCKVQLTVMTDDTRLTDSTESNFRSTQPIIQHPTRKRKSTTFQPNLYYLVVTVPNEA